MFLTARLNLGTLFFVLCTCFAPIVRTQATGDASVLKALGDHGDRIADLESIVKQLKSDYQATAVEVNALKSENIRLNAEIKELENRTEQCCSAASSVGSTAMIYTTHQPQTTVKPTTTTTAPVKYTPAPVTTTVKPTTVPLTTTDKPTTTVAELTNCEQVRSVDPQAKNATAELKIGGHHKTVFCEFDQDGAWLVIQRRQDGSVDFNRKWVEYADGFGNPTGEFWIGNEILYQLTNSNGYTLRIDLEDWGGNTRHVQYEHFAVESEFTNYRLSVGSYSGDAGDSLHYPQSTLLSHHRMMFSTPDRDNDRSFMSCAGKLESGWWFNKCYSSNLNGKYLSSPYGQHMLGETFGEPTLDGTGIEWYPYRQRQYSFKRVTMKLKLSSASVSMMG